MIREGDKALKARWAERFAQLPPDARQALRDVLLDLRADALERAELQWRRHKAPMAVYWKVVGVYAGHLARAVRMAATHQGPPGTGVRVAPHGPAADVSVTAGAPASPGRADEGNPAGAGRQPAPGGRGPTPAPRPPLLLIVSVTLVTLELAAIFGGVI